MHLNLNISIILLIVSLSNFGCKKNVTKVTRSLPSSSDDASENADPIVDEQTTDIEDGDSNQGDNDSPSAVPGETLTPPPSEGFSLNAEVRMKKVDLFVNDLKDALGFSSEEAFCLELNTYDCTSVVHNIVLGGVDAYDSAVFEPYESATESTPIAIERIALQACTKRVDDDLSDQQAAVVYKNFNLDGSNNFVNFDESVLNTTTDSLYKRFLKRMPTADESKTLRILYERLAEVEQNGIAYEWARMSCYMVATHVENIFY